MRYPLSILGLALAAGTAMVACERTPATDRAAAEAREAGEATSDALERAGREVARGAEELERRAQPMLDDVSLTARVKAKLAADPEVAAYTIDVDTLERVVTLSGRVGTATEAAEAEKLARGTEGVAQVVNRLAIGDAPQPGVAPSAAPKPPAG